MSIGKNDHQKHDYFLSETEEALQHSTEEKDIGVTIDSSLSFNQHISQKINKANSVLGQICRTFENKDKTTMITLYKALVRPHLEYANQVWAPYLIKHITSIENIQRRLTRMIPGLSELSYEQRLRVLNLPSLSYRRLRGDMIELYKIITNKYDPEITAGMISFSNTTHTRGNNYKIQKNRAKLRM